MGIDPGRRDVITAVRREVGVDKERVISVNTKQLNRLAGFHRHQKKKMQKLQEAGKALPSWSGGSACRWRAHRVLEMCEQHPVA